MPGYAKQYLKNGSAAEQKKFDKLVDEMSINMDIQSAISLALAEMRDSKKSGGRVGMASGGIAPILKL